MPKQVRLRRGTTAQHTAFTGAEGEVTFDTTKKVLVVHDGATPGGKPLEGFVLLNPGNPLLSQVINSIVSIAGGDSESVAFSVVGSAGFNHVSINETASVKRLHISQELLVFGGNVVLNFGTYGSKRITLTGDVAFSALGFGFGSRLELRILCDGTTRNLSWPAGWKFVGAAAPASIAASKTALLQLWAFGLNESDIVARYLVEP
ncbi:MAG TPA: hypothetical protein VK530_08885 [Candidatus Acidoferrum sp.]|nr:hypothetical protein [Candidatus Acidoferrum sp.]